MKTYMILTNNEIAYTLEAESKQEAYRISIMFGLTNATVIECD